MDIQHELPLAAERTVDELADFLQDGGRESLALTVTRNRVSMISVRFSPRGGATLRVHQAFRGAPDAVLLALRDYLRTRHRADWRVVTAFARAIRVHAHHAVRVPRLESLGHIHDLKQIAAMVNHEFFGGRVACQVGWGRARPVRRRRLRGRGRSIRYGSWDAVTGTVRIHPLLDDVRVPREFVRYIVFHEMLHVLVPGEWRAGRRVVHSRQFRALERRYPDLAGMRRLSAALLKVLV